MNNDAQHASPPSTRQSRQLHIESQLDFDFGDVHIPPGPDWESLPQTSRTEAMTMLARLLAKAGTAEEEPNA